MQQPLVLVKKLASELFDVDWDSVFLAKLMKTSSREHCDTE